MGMGLLIEVEMGVKVGVGVSRLYDTSGLLSRMKYGNRKSGNIDILMFWCMSVNMVDQFFINKKQKCGKGGKGGEGWGG